VSLGQNSDTPQSVAVLRQIIQVAESEGLRAPALWLEPIPALITLADLMRKYGLDDDHQNIVETTELTAIIGELDDPACQRQDVLRLPLGAEGNVIVYGAAGSGKEALLNALLCSLLYRHTARTLNCYLLDFGAESLGVFRQAPQVGDVVFSSDVEKLESFFRMMLAEIERRRKLLAEVDGGFAGYAPPARAGSGAPPSALPATDASPRADGPLPPTPPTAASPQPAGALPAAGAPPLPAILIVVNGFDAFMELNEQYAEDLGKLARDGLRCGIHCAITCTRANAVPYRLQPNFKQRLVLRLNSKDEYLTILGSLEGVVAPAGYGRGLVSRGGLYEFQTAQITANGIDGQAIRSYCAQLDAAAASDAPRAAQVPVLPEVVDAAALAGLMAAECFSLQQLPLGISKLSLKPCLANLARTPVLLALSEDEQLLSRFLSGLADVLNRVADLRVVVFDPDALLPRPSAADQRLQHLSAYDAVFEELSTLLEGKSDQRFAGSSPEGTLLIFTSLRSLVEKMPDPLKEPWARFWSDGHYRDFAGIVIAGSASRFTSFGFEPWFRELCSYGSGIWLGDGFDAQQLLRPGSYDSAHRQRHPDDLAWIVSKGSCHLARYVVSIFH
jgi:S-DNA-T family DNA segregation ATPase FtsK/SpoIIIE